LVDTILFISTAAFKMTLPDAYEILCVERVDEC